MELLFKLAGIRYNKKNGEILLTGSNGPYFYNFWIKDQQLGYDFFEKFEKADYEIHPKKTPLEKEELVNTYGAGILEYYPDLDKERLLNTYIDIVERIEKWKERKVKGQQGIRLTPSTLCNICKHRTSYTTCKAFPSGIPSELRNKLHTDKLPLQKNNIIFELGEEGSKNAGIKQTSVFDVIHVCWTENGYDKLLKKLKKEGETYGEYNPSTIFQREANKIYYVVFYQKIFYFRNVKQETITDGRKWISFIVILLLLYLQSYKECSILKTNLSCFSNKKNILIEETIYSVKWV